MFPALLLTAAIGQPLPQVMPPRPVPGAPDLTKALPSDLLYAQAAITAPSDVTEPEPAEERWEEVRVAILAQAVQWEILDPRETRYYMAKPDDFQDDLGRLKQRYQELKDAPKVSHANLLPHKDVCDHAIRFNRAHLKYLEERKLWESDRADLYQACIDETNKLYRAWDAARDAKAEFHYITYRRQSLLKLKVLVDQMEKDGWVGKDAFLFGEMPPPAPFWRFREGR